MLRKIQKIKLNENKRYFYQQKFDGGLNKFISDVHIEDNQSPDLLNVMPDEDGIIKTRPGIIALGSPAGSRTRGLGSYYKIDGTRFLIMMSGTALKKYNFSTETWDTITGFTYTDDLQADFAQGGNKFFIQNGTDNLTYTDGSTVAEQTNGQVGTGLLFGRSRLLTWGDASNPSRLYLSGTSSNVGDYSAGNGGEFIDINKDDGQAIRSVSKFGDDFLVYKDFSTYKLTFDSEGLPVVSLINPNRGAITHRAVDNVDEDVFVLTRQPGIFSQGFRPNYFNQIRTDEISLDVSPLIEDIQPDRLPYVNAIYHKHKYYLAYSEAGQTYNNKILVYDSVFKSWWLWEGWNVNSFCVYEDEDGVEHFYYGSDTDGQVYEISETATSDNGTAINSYFTTKAYSFKKFDIIKRFNWIDFLFRNIKGTLTVQVYLDSDVVNIQKTLGSITGRSGFGTGLFGRILFGIDPSGSTVTSETVSRPKRLRIRDTARTIKVKLSTNGANHYFSLLEMSIEYKEKSPRLFERQDIIN